MAQQSEANRKAQLIAQLERERHAFARSVGGLRQDLDVSSHLKHSFLSQKAVWFAGAGLTGWVLSRLPSRKRREPIAANGKEVHAKGGERGALILSILGMLIPLVRPAVTAFISQKVEEFAVKSEVRPARAVHRR